MTLSRKSRGANGVFSILWHQGGPLVDAYTLEHAFPQQVGYAPVIPNGDYTCVRGIHRLSACFDPFETFEITGVDGHTGLLFHSGNFNADSEGCVLLGDAVTGEGDQKMVTNSRATFAKFMELQAGLDQFQLSVRG